MNSVFEQNNPAYKKMSYQQVRNVSNMMKDMRSEKLIGYNMSSSDKMIIDLDENQYTYMVLKNKVHPVSLMSSLNSEAFTQGHGDKVNSLVPLSELDKDNMMCMAQDHCRTLKMTVDQELLIAIAWIMPKEVRISNYSQK